MLLILKNTILKWVVLINYLGHLSLLGIAFEAGFNSKTAFNTAFKKHTNMTPREYKKKKLDMVI
ncbi:hypothetical protein BH23BAC2_BH23BAC2_16860 [soil metagenome]